MKTSFVRLVVSFVLVVSACCSAVAQSEPVEAQCPNWSSPEVPNFEKSVQEYVRLYKAGSKDESCLQLSLWKATESLFRPEDVARYRLRLEALNERLKAARASAETITEVSPLEAQVATTVLSSPEADAIESLVVRLQLRWLEDTYEQLSNYSSKSVLNGTAVGMGAMAALSGAAVLMKNTSLKTFSKSSISISWRMTSYLGGYLYSNLSDTLREIGELAKAAQPGAVVERWRNRRGGGESTFLRPPMEYVKSDYGYWNYTDVHFFRDLAGLAANMTANYAGKTTVHAGLIWSYRALGTVGHVANKVAKPSYVGFAVGMIAGHYAQKYAELGLANVYHTMSVKEVAEYSKQMSAPGLTDWQRLVAADRVVLSSIRWLSIQDLPLQLEVIDSLAKFRKQMICHRLLMRESDEPELPHWQRKPADPGVKLFEEHLWAARERNLRSEVKASVEARRPRLETIRAGLVGEKQAIEALNSPLLARHVTQINALIDRVDAHLARTELVDAEMKTIRGILERLKTGSETWNDPKALLEYAKTFECPHPNVFR